MIGFITETTPDGEFIELYIDDEVRAVIPMNKENMIELRNRLHNDFLDADRIIRQRGYEHER